MSKFVFSPKLQYLWNRFSENKTESCKCNRKHVDENESSNFDVPDFLLEAFRVVEIGKGGLVSGNGQVQELAERLPALLDVEDEKSIGRNRSDDFRVPGFVELG